MLSFFTEDVQSIGTGIQEVAFNKAQLRALVTEEIELDPLPFQIAFEQVSAVGEESDILLYAVIRVSKLLSSGLSICVEMRQTAVFHRQEGEFLIRAVHVSVPSAEQREDEYYPIKFGEQALEERGTYLDRNLLNLFSDTMPGGIMGGYHEPGFPLYFVNNRMLEYLGYTYDEFVKATDGLVLHCIHPKDRTHVEQTVSAQLAEGDSYTVTYRMLKKDGSFLWVHDKGRLITTEAGRQAIISVCLDITDQVEAKNELSFIAQSRLGGIFTARMDEGFTLLYANPFYYQLHGYTEQEFANKFHNKTALLVHPDDIEEVSAQIERAILERKETLSLEYRVRRGDGKIAWLHASAGLTETNDGLVLSGMVINIDDRKNFEQQLLWSEKRFQIAISQTKINVWEYDLKERCILQTERSFETFGLEMTIPHVPESLIENRFIHPDDTQKYCALYERLHRGEPTANAVVRVRAVDGNYCWVKINYTNIFDKTGAPVRAIAVSEDITAQKEAEQRFFQEEQLREMLSADVLVSTKINLTQDKVFHVWSDHYPPESFQRISTYEQLSEEIISYISNTGDKKRYQELFSPQALRKAAQSDRKSLYGEYRCKNFNGRIIWCAFHLALLRDPDTSELLAFGYIRDIDERKKTELALRERAERDALTGLYNRQTAESMISQRLSYQKNPSSQCAFLIIDMDDFKQINDRHGHYFGDRILQEIGRVLRVSNYSQCIPGRLGGDEFILFFEDVPSREWVMREAAALCEKLNISYHTGNETLQISASVGVAVSPRRSASFQTMFQQADAALYGAKFQGKAQCSCFHSGGTFPHEMQLLPDSCIAKRHLGEHCMLDELDDSIFVIDAETHEVLFINSVAQKEFDIREFHDRKCYDILQGFHQPCIFCQSHLPEEHGFKVWENTNARLHKRFLIRDKMILWDGRRARLELFTDLSRHETRLGAKASAEHVLLECAALLLASTSLEAALAEILKNLGQFYRADRVYFVTIGDRSSVQILPQDWHAPGVSVLPRESERLEENTPHSWLTELRSKQVVVFSELKQLRALFPEKYKTLREKQMHAFAAVALMSESELIGYIGIENPRINLDNTTMLQSLSYFLYNEIAKRRMEQQQHFVAEHDALTGLYNWQSYTRTLSNLQPEALSSLGVLVADVSHLHLLNQEYGPAYGDKLLCLLADTLKIEFGAQSAFRLSGDSFIVLCEDITYEAFLSQAEDLREQMDGAYPGSIFFGYAWADEDIDPNRMINSARKVLSISKGEERGNIQSDQRLRAIRLQRLHEAIEQRHFQIYLQPKAEISTGTIRGAEALVRYVDESHGVVPPDRFIPQLEAERNIRHIDLFVLEEVCRTLQRWKRHGLHTFPISMNFSRCTLLEEGIVEHINKITSRYEVERALLEIEITESMGQLERRTLSEISQKIIGAGYRLSLDDFGSEYSNISILSSLSLNGLKFDKSVMNDLYSNPTTRLLVGNLISVCRQMGIDSIAEGIEEPEQLDILKDFGCVYAQGYLYNKPIPVPDFERKYLKFPC